MREKRGLTQVQLAQKLCQPQSYVSRIESGERSIGALALIGWCKAMDLEAWEVLKAYE